MHPPRPKVATVEEYMKLFPKETAAVLQQIRDVIRLTAPDAEERISYAIPAYRTPDRRWVYFSGYEKHVSLYPAPREVSADFEKQLAPYRAGKGTLRFPLDKPLPLGLIRKVAQGHVKRLQKASKK